MIDYAAIRRIADKLEVYFEVYFNRGQLHVNCFKCWQPWSIRVVDVSIPWLVAMLDHAHGHDAAEPEATDTRVP